MSRSARVQRLIDTGQRITKMKLRHHKQKPMPFPLPYPTTEADEFKAKQRFARYNIRRNESRKRQAAAINRLGRARDPNNCQRVPTRQRIKNRRARRSAWVPMSDKWNLEHGIVEVTNA